MFLQKPISLVPNSVSKPEDVVFGCSCRKEFFKLPELSHQLSLTVGNYSTFSLTCAVPTISDEGKDDSVAREQIMRRIEVVARQSWLKRVIVIICANCANCNNSHLSQPKELSSSELDKRKDEVCKAMNDLHRRVKFGSNLRFEYYLVETLVTGFLLHPITEEPELFKEEASAAA